jgi:valyl-tRNA synthetase
MGKKPFDNILIHGLVRDAQGRKMSKSLGNGIDPLEIISEYGADALRFALATGNSPGNDMRFSEDKITSSRNFANKLWNASRFILMNIGDDIAADTLPETLSVEDKWFVSKCNTLIKEVTDNIDKFELGIAVQKLYDFIWDIMCDWYIELSKPRLQEGGEAAKAVQHTLVYVMDKTLKLLHPFMPFITEEIWQAIPHNGDSIMISDWPQYKEELNFSKEENEFEVLMNAIKAIRTQRSSMNVPPSKKADLFIETQKGDIFKNGDIFLKRLASANEVHVGESFNIEDAVQIVTNDARVLIPLKELIDRDKELARLTKEKETCEKDYKMISGKLQNPGFLAKAPEAVVEGEKVKLQKITEKLKLIEESLKKL